MLDLRGNLQNPSNWRTHASRVDVHLSSSSLCYVALGAAFCAHSAPQSGGPRSNFIQTNGSSSGPIRARGLRGPVYSRAWAWATPELGPDSACCEMLLVSRIRRLLACARRRERTAPLGALYAGTSRRSN